MFQFDLFYYTNGVKVIYPVGRLNLPSGGLENLFKNPPDRQTSGRTEKRILYVKRILFQC